MVPSRMGTATLVSIFSDWDAGMLPLLTLPVSVVPRAPEDLARPGSGILPTLAQHRSSLPDASLKSPLAPHGGCQLDTNIHLWRITAHNAVHRCEIAEMLKAPPHDFR